MAEIAYTQSRTSNGDTLITWTGVTEADTFQALQLGGTVSHLFIQIGGTFGGATVVVNGSNDDSVYGILTDQSATAISATSALVSSIYEKPLYIQPSASGGTSQSLTVKLLLRR